MDDPNNPYLSPNPTALNPLTPLEGEDPRNIGKARQVRTVAILMIVHGVLMFISGCILIGLAFWLPAQVAKQFELQQQMQQKMNPKAPQISAEFMGNMMFWVYCGMGCALFAIGVINVFAGSLNYGYRGRIFGIISMIVSLGSIFFCYCLPLSVGLLIYGLIIYLSPEAEQAFHWRSTAGPRLTPYQAS